MSNTKSSNQTAVPEAKGALDRFKFEVANELGVPLTDGYNGNLTSKQNGSVGGYMVKKIVSEQPLNFNSIFYIIPRVIVNYRTTFPGIQKALRYRQKSIAEGFPVSLVMCFPYSGTGRVTVTGSCSSAGIFSASDLQL